MANRILPALRSTLFYLGYILTLIPHTTLCVLLGWMLPLKSRFRFFVLWNRFSIWWLKITCGVEYRIHGVENIPAHPFVLLSNHQCPWETIFLYAYFAPLCAILKMELLRIPFFGWAMALLGPIAINRKNPRLALKTLLTMGKARLQAGISVLVFPEGTRVAPGVEKKYSSGGAALAITSGVLVLPVAHNAGLFWPSKKFLKTAGVIDVVIGAAIATTNREPRELTEAVQLWTQHTLTHKEYGL
ncbi:MAG: lysophospholipid acyltransferase family protein [Pseudohongiellaceae bacterium]